jgi:hypothetical protein
VSETDTQDIIGELDWWMKHFGEPTEILAAIQRARDEIVALRDGTVLKAYENRAKAAEEVAYALNLNRWRDRAEALEEAMQACATADPRGRYPTEPRAMCVEAIRALKDKPDAAA